MSKNKISKERQATYYVGIGLSIVGFLVFISNFFNTPSVRSGFGEFEAGMNSMATTAITGMVMIIAGTIISQIGAKGAAGSGLILDPDKARDDLKPWSVMTGGIINDAVSQIDAINTIKPDVESKSEIKTEVMIRCRSCKALNDEDAKFCKNCGEEL